PWLRPLAAVLVLSTGSVASAAEPLPALPPSRLAARHDTHVSHARCAVEAASVVCRVRLFRDDLELALRAARRDHALALTPAARQDSAFQAYAATRLVFTADGVRLSGRVIESGVEVDQAKQQVAWYTLEFTAPRPVRTLIARNTLLFDAFNAQQNIMQLLKLPENRRQTLYFAAGDEGEQRVW
ncbi:MAG: DUF6702 family protein, partial [Gemmatimonadota bacterium]